MNFIQLILNLPYQVTWKIYKQLNKVYQVDFFCGSYVDYICFRNIHHQIPEIRVVAKNRTIRSELRSYGIQSVLYPTFPNVILMARHSTRKYPVKAITKIGMRHGAYHFKNFIASPKYNAFDKYLFTSINEVLQAKERGITSGVAVGFPKIDDMFNGSITELDLNELRKELKLDSAKKTIIFTATWDKRAYSAIDKWILRIEELATDYNVLVTVHDWLSAQKKDILSKYKNIKYIDDKYILPYLMITDVMIADTSSIIAEFCALNKPIITFRVPEIRRLTSEITMMLDEISFRIDSFDELKDVLNESIRNPDLHKSKRMYYNKLMFDDLDGQASTRATNIIKESFQHI